MGDWLLAIGYWLLAFGNWQMESCHLIGNPTANSQQPIASSQPPLSCNLLTTSPAYVAIPYIEQPANQDRIS